LLNFKVCLQKNPFIIAKYVDIMVIFMEISEYDVQQIKSI